MIFIFILALLVFGPQKLPELGRTLGKALADFKKASNDLRDTFEHEMREAETQLKETSKQVENTIALNQEAAPDYSGVSETPHTETKPAESNVKPA
ncbi:MAG: twin-arginine translocase TatA/TatE family subunit [Acidobacteria bacterium]|nr:twin-arginine translocase TatA/TatE family subunit [Acidobacteriota bacterium]